MTTKGKKIPVIATVLLRLAVVAIGAAALGAWVFVWRGLPTIDAEIVARGV